MVNSTVRWYRAAIPLAPQHKAGEMNGSDLIVIGPWILFAVCLVAVCLRLLHARRSAQRSSPAPHRQDD
jgi:hypothetical protein